METEAVGFRETLDILERFEPPALEPVDNAVTAAADLLEETSLGAAGERAFVAALQRHQVESNFAAAQPAPPSLNDYRNEALRLIGGEGGDVRQRNAKISGAYADLYLQNPEAFRWLGAAAYASGQVGFAMDGGRIASTIANLPTKVAEEMLYKVLNEVPKQVLKTLFPAVPDQVWDTLQSSVPEFVKRGAVKALLAALPGVGVQYVLGKIVGHVVEQNAGNLEKMLADGNIEIYKDIYPIALAYQRGGMAELDRLAATLSGPDRARFMPMRDAFADIDRGVKLRNSGQVAAGERLIEQGNRKIIDFEQRVVAQPIAFDPNPALTYLISPLAFGNLAADPLDFSDPSTLSYYWQNHAPHSIGDANQRVDWISNEIFPRWYQQHSQQPGLVRSNMDIIIKRGRAAGGRY